MPTLDIAICTLNEGITRVGGMLLPPYPGISYVVSWQRVSPEAQTMPVPSEITDRSDVQLTILSSSGLSANRNNALKQASADIILIADDDCRYTLPRLRAIIQAYEDHPEASVICFRMTDHEGRFFKHYPVKPFRYPDLPYGYYFASWEISLRRDIRKVPFDTHFGLGAPFFGAGEEEVWLHDVHKKYPEATILYLPITIGTTDPITTGDHFLTHPLVQHARSALIGTFHSPLGALPRIVRTALTAPASFGKRMLILRNMIRGYIHFLHLHR